MNEKTAETEVGFIVGVYSCKCGNFCISCTKDKEKIEEQRKTPPVCRRCNEKMTEMKQDVDLSDDETWNGSVDGFELNQNGTIEIEEIECRKNGDSQ